MERVLLYSATLSAVVLLYWYVVPQRLRSTFLVAASFCFMSMFSLKYALYFVLNVLLVYFIGKSMQGKENSRPQLVKFALIWLIGSLCFFKYNHIVLDVISSIGISFPSFEETVFTRIAVPIGLSYIIFRLIHYIVEVYRNSLPAHSFTDLALYTLFFPTFVAGPVDRFQRFQPQISGTAYLDSAELNSGLLRILTGVLKKFVIADYLSSIVMPLLLSPGEYAGIIVLLAVYGLAFQIYMDFSGYTDMALGIASLFGFKIMENFNYPMFRNNIALFWRNWHISVYSFIRDYFFLPVFGYRATQAKIYIGMFLTMMVFMIWHELSIPFIALGIYNGAGLVVWQMFQEVKRKTPALRKFVDSKYMNPACILLTYSFVSFGFVFFSFKIQTSRDIFAQIIF